MICPCGRMPPMCEREIADARGDTGRSGPARRMRSDGYLLRQATARKKIESNIMGLEPSHASPGNGRDRRCKTPRPTCSLKPRHCQRRGVRLATSSGVSPMLRTGFCDQCLQPAARKHPQKGLPFEHTSRRRRIVLQPPAHSLRFDPAGACHACDNDHSGHPHERPGALERQCKPRDAALALLRNRRGNGRSLRPSLTVADKPGRYAR